MYSLYRAWLSMNPCLSAIPSVPLNLTLSSNSTTITTTTGQVPETPDVTLQVGPLMTQFSAHRNILSLHSGYFKAALSNYSGLSPILVPNVNVDEFSSLLTFMYTGYLDLNIRNIYSILLATHILHMPRALEICRHFLLQQPNEPQQPQQQQQQQQLQQQKINVIKPIARREMPPTMQEFFNPTHHHNTIQKSDEIPLKRTNSPQASTSKHQESVRLINAEKKILPASTKPHHVNKKHTESTSSSPSTKDKVIVDVACCDGPVRFHRVINKNYGLQNTENYETNSTFNINNNNNNNNRSSVTDFSASSALNKVMNENIMEKLNNNNSEEDNNQSNEIFTCVYCNHTFKSQYCYQKHARRHLYPVSVDNKIVKAEGNKREVKLLDMNVQYYPCKTCGGKFPSYYFVHKHRKMCHAEEVADKTNKNNEIVVENAQAQEEISNNSSAIDVEAVQNDENEQDIIS